jgi:monofunctional biosynthetic peptidoglycan transglycosylase
MRISPRRALIGGMLVLLAVLLLYPFIVLLRAHWATPDVLATARRLEREGLSWSQVPPEWRDILLQVEDPGFYEHNGVDVSTPGAGMTTITQGLVKIHYFERFRPGFERKLRQSLMAVVLDRKLPKDQQLTLFLHTANLGTGADGYVVGFPAAAEAYFDKPFHRLERREFIALVAMLLGPNRYHPHLKPDALAQRVDRIEALLADQCRPSSRQDVLLEDCPSR